VAALLAELLLGRLARLLADLRPAAGQRPEPVVDPAHEEHAPVAERRRADVDLRRRVTCLRRERRDELLRRELAGGHLGRDVPDLLVPLAVKRMRVVREPALRDRLEPPHPVEPDP
jgi:hypothetical protein